MGNRQHPPRHSIRPQGHPPPHRQTKTKVAPPRRRSHAPGRPLRLGCLEEKRLRLIKAAPNAGRAREGTTSVVPLNCQNETRLQPLRLDPINATESESSAPFVDLPISPP